MALSLSIKLIAIPFFPNRPVLPMRCKYVSQSARPLASIVCEKRGVMGDSKSKAKKVVKKTNNKNNSNLDKKANAVTKETINLPFIPKNFLINSCQQMDVNNVQPSVNKERNRSPIQKETDVKCSGCENMAKNFLYLQSLISTNYVPKKRCDVCYSALQYLQYVNENLIKVFGNFDSVVEAGKAFANLSNNFEKPKVAKPKSRAPQARSASMIVIKAASLKKPTTTTNKPAKAKKLSQRNRRRNTREASRWNCLLLNDIQYPITSDIDMDFNLNEEHAKESQPITPVNKTIGAYKVEMKTSERILSEKYLHEILNLGHISNGSTHKTQASYFTH
uniref:Uncharacterized protein n=1 Tax=Glossina austeni TaxID=7395 RepID=A0A1A9V6C9_GLOAU